jgi:hypothetical protein
MSDPKADCHALMNFVLRFAKQMLTTQGAFFPFGGAMRPDGQLVAIGGCDGNEHPQSVDVIALMNDGFIAAAREGEYANIKATAIVYDARVKLPSTEEKSDAIAVSLNHRSVKVLYPYKIDSRKLVLGTVFAQKGEADIFPAQ